MKFFNRAQSKDLPHISGIKTLSHRTGHHQCEVGRLAPRIGD